MSSCHSSVIRVLHVLGSLRPGGIETWLMNILRLRDNRWKLDFFLRDPSTNQGAYYAEAQLLGAHIYHDRPVGRFRKRLAIIGLAPSHSRLHEVLSSGRYDVVHVHGEEFLGDVMKEAHAAGVPVRVAHCHSNILARGKLGFEIVFRRFRHRTLDRFRLLCHATDMLACSREAGLLLAGQDWDTDKRCKVLYCGIPLQLFELALKNVTRDQLLSLYGLPSNAIVVGNVGSMGPTPIKNQQFLVKVFAELANRDSRYRLFLAGDGPLRPLIQSQVRHSGLNHLVVMPGIVHNVPELMTKLFDVHVMPSINEGFGITVTEATAAGLTSVLSTGIPQEVSESFPGRTCRISLSAGISEWADAVERALRSRENPARGIERLFNSPFSIEGSANALYKIYAKSLNCRT